MALTHAGKVFVVCVAVFAVAAYWLASRTEGGIVTITITDARGVTRYSGSPTNLSLPDSPDSSARFASAAARR